MKYAIPGYEDVTAEYLLGIFGNPIKHTLSPVIHDTLSDALGLSERYVPFCVEDEELSHCVKLAYDEGVLGLNITVPHKQHVMETLVDVDIAAKTIGAVNTLVRVEGGYKGCNTDMPGLAKALETEGIALKDETVIMLGAGGAARAVAYMCVSYGAKQVYIVNRTYAHAQAIADDMNAFAGKTVVQAVASEDYKSIPDGKYLMIQCTSVGLHEGDGMPFDFGDAFYAMAKAGVDLIYNPAQTPFLKEMAKLGVPAVNGLKMLLYQGILAYELWNNLTVSETLTDKVYLALQDAIYGKKRGDNIVLIGYMGAGKTTVGKALAKKLGYEFIDTDLYIEAQEGMTIPDIFEKKGEAYFRALETDVIRNQIWSVAEHTFRLCSGIFFIDGVKRDKWIWSGDAYQSFFVNRYLMADADTTYARVKHCTNRPLLQCDDPYAKIQAMMKERGSVYARACHIRVRTDCGTLEEVMDEIK